MPDRNSEYRQRHTERLANTLQIPLRLAQLRPEPPRGVTLAANTVAWEPPNETRNVTHYNIYAPDENTLIHRAALGQASWMPVPYSFALVSSYNEEPRLESRKVPAVAGSAIIVSGGTPPPAVWLEGHLIADEGAPLPPRASLNFVGSGVTAADDAANNRTTVTIPGLSPWTQNIDAAGYALHSAGNVAIGNNGAVPPFAATGYPLLLLGKTSGSGFGIYSGCGHVTGPASAVAGYGGSNYAVAAPEKRLAEMRIDTDGATDSGAFLFNTWNLGAVAERMRISAAGNVGIGISGPQELLHISSASNSSVRIDSGSGAAPFVQFHRGAQQWWVGPGLQGDSSLVIYDATSARFVLVITAAGTIHMFLGGSLKALSVDGSGFVKAA